MIFPQHNDSDVHFQDTQFNGVDVRVFMPWAHGEEVHGKNKTGVVFIHGGGWSVGNVGQYYILQYYYMIVVYCRFLYYMVIL